MGILDFFRTNQAAREVAPSISRYATWVDPPVSPPTEEWERRLNNYARKCARQLHEAEAPLFQSENPGEDCYRDAFWLIACDVEWGERAFVAIPWFNDKAGYQKGDIYGWFYGRALLLSKSGVLCSAFLQATLVKKGGGVNDRAMSARFTEIEHSMSRFRSADWGWSNQGRWRRDPSRDLTYQGAKFRINGELFEHWHRYRDRPDDGRDTSAALTSFVKTNGKVRWPKWFLS